MHKGYISAGEPLHDMAIRLTLDDDRKIIDIEAVIGSGPYNVCPQAVINCEKLKGEFVVSGFNRKVLKILGSEKRLPAYNRFVGSCCNDSLSNTLERKNC